MSYSRTQKSTALSRSCESEVLAASGAASEGVLLKKLMAFLPRMRLTWRFFATAAQGDSGVSEVESEDSST